MSERVDLGDGRVRLYCGDCLDVLRELEANSVDAVVTDPPAGIAFMGKEWDHHRGGRDKWIAWLRSIMEESLRVLKPGGHALVWSLPRTSHWTATAVEDAGFELRDSIIHVFGSGFPKSLDVSKAIDKAAGAEREVVCRNPNYRPNKEAHARAIMREMRPGEAEVRSAPATPAARQWSGWGTALKPAYETWWLARKPLSESTVAANVLRWGTGGLNIEGCRVQGVPPSVPQPRLRPAGFDSGHALGASVGRNGEMSQACGRWPAHLIHDGSDEVVGLFPQTGVSVGGRAGHTAAYCGGFKQEHYGDTRPGFGDSGSAARFFYCAKASKADRDEGCEGMEERRGGSLNIRTDAHSQAKCMDTGPRRNHHPTVKPTALMRYLCRLITPPGGIVLDPFMGSGTTGKAAILEGFGFIGIELDRGYFRIARRRIEAAIQEQDGQLLGMARRTA